MRLLYIKICLQILLCKQLNQRKVNIRAQGRESWRIVVVLTILASEEKLTLLLIFKAEEGKDAERKLQQIE